MRRLVLLLFSLILVGNFSAFLTLEAIALEDPDDEIGTLSSYIKRWVRRHGLPARAGLAAAIVGAAAYLLGHLVF